MSNHADKTIKKAFINLLEKTPSNKITVKMIVSECGISRNTFYYYFYDVPDLIESIFKEIEEEVKSECQFAVSQVNGFDYCFELLTEHKRAVYNIYNSSDRDIFIKYLRHICECFVRNTADDTFNKNNISDDDKELLISFYRCICFGVVIDWLEGGMQEDSVMNFQRLIELQKVKQKDPLL